MVAESVGLAGQFADLDAEPECLRVRDQLVLGGAIALKAVAGNVGQLFAVSL
jgi:hypothetical protein